MTEAAIVVNNLTKIYGSPERGVKALDHVNLTIPKGMVFGLLGPNGAGKTTLIKVLTGITDITEGHGLVAGFDIQLQPMEAKARIGWVAAEVILDDDFTARENLWLQAKLQSLTGWEERAEQLLEYFSLKDRADDKVSHFSTGMRKKLEIALALLHQPSVIFMDEPTIGLDVSTRRMLWDIVTQVHKEFGVTVLLTTHYIEEADALCERIAIIDRGRILAEGTPSELKARVKADIVQLETAEALDSGALAAVPGVQEVRGQGDGWTLRVTSSEEVLPRLFAAIHPDRIRRISVEKPSLETVFLEITGRRIGEDEPIRDVRKFYAQMQRARR
ncbi:MAG TPA: ATP-binding cassette domain-containing protein [Thermoplasmata archaeon]|nr:ATP-binding cassette domain-containing protein [Thermoplasmata archaeon]